MLQFWTADRPTPSVFLWVEDDPTHFLHSGGLKNPEACPP